MKIIINECDICGKREEKHKSDLKNPVPYIRSLSVSRVIGYGCNNVGSIETRDFDLCDECSEKVFSLLKKPLGLTAEKLDFKAYSDS